MKLRVYVEDQEDAGRQDVVAYVSGEGDGPFEIESVVQQGDPRKAREACAALIAAGLHAADHVGEEEVRGMLDRFRSPDLTPV